MQVPWDALAGWVLARLRQEDELSGAGRKNGTPDFQMIQCLAHMGPDLRSGHEIQENEPVCFLP